MMSYPSVDESMKVVHFHRKPNRIAFSIEQLFADIRSALPKDLVVEAYECRYPSKGLWRRVYEVFRAARNQGDVNHITGDVHFLSLLLNRRKTMLTIHDCVSLERLRGLRYWVCWFFWYWLPSKRCKLVTVISESTKQELRRHLSSQNLRIEVVPDCVSNDFQLHRKDFDEQCPRILQIGTTKNKNLDRLAEALEGLVCKLIIVGKLSAEQLETLNQHNIDFENHCGISRAELIQLYQQCDLVMFASLYEGFGLPILEANAIGRPVISSHLYSMPEVGGDAACYVNPYDVASIRNAVTKIIKQPEYRNRLIEQGIQNVQRFTPAAIAQKYAALYRELHPEIGSVE